MSHNPTHYELINLPPISAIATSARGRGRHAIAYRLSAHSLSGAVAVVSFASFHQAQGFARLWAMLLPGVCGGVAVRHSTRNPSWFRVSIPTLG